jgi:hypothetical protein
MLFRGKAKRDGAASQDRLHMLCEKDVSYVVLRVLNGETIIGKNGYINLADGRVIISCEGKVVFDKALSDISVGELMSKNGATFTYIDEATQNKITVVAYYSYYRK